MIARLVPSLGMMAHSPYRRLPRAGGLRFSRLFHIKATPSRRTNLGLVNRCFNATQTDGGGGGRGRRGRGLLDPLAKKLSIKPNFKL